jgi:hypothetical protein
MANELFRLLNAEDEKAYRINARESYTPGNTISSLWHPVFRHECEKMNMEDVMRNHVKANSYWHFKSEKHFGDVVHIPEEEIDVQVRNMYVQDDDVVCDCTDLSSGSIETYTLDYLNSL